MVARVWALGIIAAVALSGCKNDKKQSDSAPSENPGQDPGEVKIDTENKNEQKVDDKTKLDDKDKVEDQNAVAVTVSGTVALATALRLDVAPEQKATKVIGIKAPKNSDQWRGKPTLKVVDVGADGKFSFPFTNADKNEDWILLLIDDTQPSRADRFVGFVGISDGGDGMIRLPMPAAKSDIGLGIVTPPPDGSDTALSESNLDDVAKSFTIDKASLAEIAKTDSILRNAKNLVLNFDLETEAFYVVEPAYTWQINRATALLADVDGIPPSLAETSDPTRAKYSAAFRTTDVPFTHDEFCDGTADVKLTAPMALTADSKTYTYFSNAGTLMTDASLGTCSFTQVGGDGGSLTESRQTPGESYQSIANNIQFQADPLPPIPQGYWSYEVKLPGDADFTQHAAFDLAASSPFVKQGTNLVPLMYVPTVRVLVGGDGIIEGFEVKWWYHDGTGMVQVQDIRSIFGILDKVHFYFTDFKWDCDGGTNNGLDAAKRCEGRGEIAKSDIDALADKSKIVVTKGLEWGWKFQSADAENELNFDRISMSFLVGGVSFSWTWQ